MSGNRSSIISGLKRSSTGLNFCRCGSVSVAPFSPKVYQSSDSDHTIEDSATSTTKPSNLQSDAAIFVNQVDHCNVQSRAVQYQEYIEERFSDENSPLSREKFHSIEEIQKYDLNITRHLGKGSFSNVFEVVATFSTTMSIRQRTKSLDNYTDDVDRYLFQQGSSDGRESSKIDSQLTHICQGGDESRYTPKQRRLTLAMKCLHPEIRAESEEFMVGIEDLIHETVVLASLEHPNIIKIHGRAAAETISQSFQFNNGYFILMDRLVDTLEDRIVFWRRNLPKNKSCPSLKQINVARSLADALAYLHKNNIIFRDLKPANVGFDSNGVVKLFDFGFATEIPHSSQKEECDSSSDGGIRSEEPLLYDIAGTTRYLAPEMARGEGYTLKADVYSFGILFWEICHLKKPFRKWNLTEEFHKNVFAKGARPKLGKNLANEVRELISSCWSENPLERPSMNHVMTNLSNMSGDGSIDGRNSANVRPKRKKFSRQFTWAA